MSEGHFRQASALDCRNLCFAPAQLPWRDVKVHWQGTKFHAATRPLFSRSLLSAHDFVPALRLTRTRLRCAGTFWLQVLKEFPYAGLSTRRWLVKLGASWQPTATLRYNPAPPPVACLALMVVCFFLFALVCFAGASLCVDSPMHVSWLLCVCIGRQSCCFLLLQSQTFWRPWRKTPSLQMRTTLTSVWSVRSREHACVAKTLCCAVLCFEK